MFESKLRPAEQRPSIVPRTAVTQRLRGARHLPVVVVEAPAGSGKTTAVAQWATADPRQLGWYTLDEQDNDPLVFLTYLTALLGRVGADVERVAERLTGPWPAIPAVGEALSTAFSSIPAPAILVLDEVHLLENQACLAVLSELLGAVPHRSQLVLVTRKPLDISLEPLRGAARLLEVGFDELRMTDSEARTLLHAEGIELSEADVHAVTARCEGWATGLYLVALAARAAAGRVPEGAFLGADRFITDYFRLELLERLAEDDRDLLLRLSVLDRVCGPLCDVALERKGSADDLTRIARTNSFLFAADEPGWFKLHPLFSDMLQMELAHTDHGRSERVLAGASKWYEERDDIEAAVELALLAGDGHRAADLASRVILGLYWTGRSATVRRWCAAIDDPLLLAAHPAVALLGACILAIEGRPHAAQRWAEAGARVDAETVMPDGSPAAAWTANARAMLYLNGLAAMRRDAEFAAENLAEGSPLMGGCLTALGFAHLLGGDAERAGEVFVSAVRTALGLGGSVGASTSLAALSLIAAENGNAGEADELATRAIEIANSIPLDDYPPTAYVYAARARAALLCGRKTAAREALLAADGLVSGLSYGLPWLAIPTRIELAHLHLAFGDPGSARQLLHEIDMITVQQPDTGVLHDHIGELRHELQRGRSSKDSWMSTLTPAEYRLLPLLASYLTFREISERLGVSRNTVKTQAIAVYRKLGVNSRSGAVEQARELGLLSVEGAPIW